MRPSLAIDPSAWEADRALATRIGAGDEGAFADLVDSLHRPLLRVAESYVGRGATAEDLVQETWERVVDHLAEFQGRASLRTWITRILVNRAITRRTRDKRTVLLDDAAGDGCEDRFSGLGLWTSVPETADGPEERLLRKEAGGWLVQALDALPETQRTVVTLRDVEEWSSEEVCNALGISESNQRVLLHRGRQKLRAALEERVRADGRS